MAVEKFDWAENIPKKRMPVDQCPRSSHEMLSHAHYLLDGIEQFADNPEKIGKTGRHLGSAQTLLWVAGWYTLAVRGIFLGIDKFLGFANIMEIQRPSRC